ncbi:MAG: three-Cys-motif partner protein TcmP [Candidatus Thiodiazotropha endolucinida]
MTRVHYDFKPCGPYATIKSHSVAKHDVLRSYLSAYFQTLAPSHKQEELKVTLVDGFAGGGVYEHADTKEIVFGSPFVFLQAAKEAEALINCKRQKPLRMNIDYFFIEKKRDAFKLLSETLKTNGYSDRLNEDIKLIHGDFEQQVTTLVDFISKKNPRKGRSIFFLDQYGYKDVPANLVRTILNRFPSAEVILTFAVDSFINYATDSPLTLSSLDKVGIPEALKGRTIEDIKSNERDFRLYIQSCLHESLVKACGARYYTTFFIRTGGHGDYWLVHLSQHHRARDVMTRIHWMHNNNFIHYGGPGLDMFHTLGYDPNLDSSLLNQFELDFCFDDPAHKNSVKMLKEQIPHHVYASDTGISFGELFATTCNNSPADSQRYKDAIASLINIKEIEVYSPDGSQRRKATTIKDTDLLIPSKQITMSF